MTENKKVVKGYVSLIPNPISTLSGFFSKSARNACEAQCSVMGIRTYDELELIQLRIEGEDSMSWSDQGSREAELKAGELNPCFPLATFIGAQEGNRVLIPLHNGIIADLTISNAGGGVLGEFNLPFEEALQLLRERKERGE